MIAQATPTIPQALEAEAALLGACIMDSALVMPIVGDITVADFTKVQHRVVFAALLDLHAAGVKVDMVTLHQHLRDQKQLDGIGGLDYLLALAEAVPVVESAHYYADIIKKKAIQRQRVTAAEKLLERVKDNGTAEEVLELTRDLNQTHPPRIRPMTATEISLTAADLMPPVVEGLIRRGEVGTIIGAPKSRKSWCMMSLCMAVAAGGDRRPDWLGLEVMHGRALLADFELTLPTLAHRQRLVMESMGLDLHLLGDRFKAFPLRGERFDIGDLERMADDFQRDAYDLIVIDPLYRCYPPDYDENSNADAASLYARFAALAAKVNAAVLIVHHLAKGTADRKVTDSGAGAGAMARAGDVHAVIRPNEADENAATFEAVVRSFKPLPKIPLRTRGVVWDRDDAATIDDTPWSAERFAREVVGPEPRRKDSILLAAADHGIRSKREASAWLTAAEDARLLTTTTKRTTVFYAYSGGAL